MSENRNATCPGTATHDDAGFRSSSTRRESEMNDWVYMLLIAVTAALVVGVLAVPVTMRTETAAASHAGFGLPGADTPPGGDPALAKV